MTQTPVERYAPENTEGEHQIFGPPGTGKTTTLSRWIERAVKAFGSTEVILTSFTKAAATELVSRGLPILPDNIATLHAHCYRAMHKPTIVETDKDLIKTWNTNHAQWALGAGNVDVDDPLADEAPQGATPGDELFSKYQLLRARMAEWRIYPLVRAFAEAWEDFKRETHSIDFTDMIDVAAREINYAPGNPSVIFVDEAQDMTKLEWSVVRKWGKRAKHFVVAGDDDQCVYNFKGASPETFFETDLPDSRKHVLEQSHRVPQAVHQAANRWIAALTKRKEKVYRPRVDKDGKIVSGELRWLGNASFLQPRNMIDDAENYLADGKSVMFLATCAYMLNDLKKDLRIRGHVFHNPYRRKRGDWNPLGRGKGIEALLAYLRPRLHADRQFDESIESLRALVNTPLWTKHELCTWLDQLSVSAFLNRGAKKQIEECEKENDEAVFGIDFEGWLKDTNELITMANGDLGWFMEHVTKANQSKYDYLCNVFEKRGAKALTDKPRIIIGTIHSVKGGESDVVYLMPDLSRRGYESWSNFNTRDEVIRQMYVGMTRCRETLVITNPGSEYYVKGLHRI
jgi:DNA helicase-2/ATP-dependent DNA helicase PcrA